MRTTLTPSPTPHRLRELVSRIPLLNDLFGPRPDPLAPRCRWCDRRLRNTVVTFDGRRYTVKACRRCLQRAQRRYELKYARKEEDQ